MTENCNEFVNIAGFENITTPYKGHLVYNRNMVYHLGIVSLVSSPEKKGIFRCI